MLRRRKGGRKTSLARAAGNSDGGHPESGEGNGPALSSAGLLLLFSAFVFKCMGDMIRFKIQM